MSDYVADGETIVGFGEIVEELCLPERSATSGGLEVALSALARAKVTANAARALSLVPFTEAGVG